MEILEIIFITLYFFSFEYFNDKRKRDKLHNWREYSNKKIWWLLLLLLLVFKMFDGLRKLRSKTRTGECFPLNIFFFFIFFHDEFSTVGFSVGFFFFCRRFNFFFHFILKAVANGVCDLKFCQKCVFVDQCFYLYCVSEFLI